MTTPIQYKIYTFIQAYLLKHGFSPSLVEIARGIGISPNSISLVSRTIHALVKDNKLRFHKTGYRNIQVVNESPLSLPFMGRIAAGAPIEAIEDRQTVDFSAFFKGEDYFALEVKGDSMVDEGIWDGDLVICKRVARAEEGEIVVALIDRHDATLKQISYQLKGYITLIPANSALKPKAYPAARIQIQGVFKGLMRIKK